MAFWSCWTITGCLIAGSGGAPAESAAEAAARTGLLEVAALLSLLAPEELGDNPGEVAEANLEDGPAGAPLRADLTGAFGDAPGRVLGDARGTVGVCGGMLLVDVCGRVLPDVPRETLEDACGTLEADFSWWAVLGNARSFLLRDLPPERAGIIGCAVGWRESTVAVSTGGLWDPAELPDDGTEGESGIAGTGGWLDEAILPVTPDSWKGVVGTGESRWVVREIGEAVVDVLAVCVSEGCVERLARRDTGLRGRLLTERSLVMGVLPVLDSPSLSLAKGTLVETEGDRVIGGSLELEAEAPVTFGEIGAERGGFGLATLMLLEGDEWSLAAGEERKW